MNKWYKQGSYQKLVLRRGDKYYCIHGDNIHPEAVILLKHRIGLYIVDPKEDITKYRSYKVLSRFALKLESDLYQELMK